MKKSVKQGNVYVSNFLFVVLAIVLVSGIVFAAHVIKNSAGGTTLSFNEDVENVYNLTINITDNLDPANITQVNVTWPASMNISFKFNSEGINATGLSQNISVTSNFVNTTNLLSWTNTSGLINASLAKNLTYVWFNLTVNTPQVFNISVRTTNATATFESNITVTINDTQVPLTVEYGGNSFANNTYFKASALFLNFTATDDGVLATILIRLHNATNSLVNSSLNASSPAYINFTGHADGVYFVNASANDSINNVNTSVLRTYVIDTTMPLVQYVSPTNATGLFTTEKNLTINVTATDTNLANISIHLFNSSGSAIRYNVTTTSPNNHTYANLDDGVYFFNANATDNATNINATVMRNITVDATGPSSVEYGENSFANNTYFKASALFLNFTAADAISLSGIVVRLFNSTQAQVNSSVNVSATAYKNFTGHADGVYFVNASANDSATNVNWTVVTRTFIIDTTMPLVQYVSPTNDTNTYTSEKNITINVTATDTNLANITIRLINSSGATIRSNTTVGNNSITNNHTYTNLADGVYTFNASATDNATNINWTVSRTLTVDTTSSTVTINSPTAITYTADNAIVNISINENGTCLYSLNTGTGNTSMTDTSSIHREFTSNTPSLANGVHTLSAYCNDSAGNMNNTKTVAFTIAIAAASSGSGGSASSTPASSWQNTYLVSESQVTSGYTKEMAAKERAEVKVSNTKHYVGIKSVTSTSVLVEVTSTPQNATMNIGDTKKFEVTNDGYYDIQVKLNGVKSSKANITITKIYEKIEAPAAQPVVDETDASAQPGEESQAAVSGKGKVWLVVVILVIILVVVVYAVYNKKGKKITSGFYR